MHIELVDLFSNNLKDVHIEGEFISSYSES